MHRSHGFWTPARRRGYATIVGAVGLSLWLGGLGCGPTGGDARVLRVREVVGSLEVAEDGDSELRKMTTDRGIRLLTRGAMLKVAAESRVKLEFKDHAAQIWVHGPAEVEVGEVRLERSGGGVHAKIEDIHAGLHLHDGAIAVAMEGKEEERPSLEIFTAKARVQADFFGRLAVIRQDGSHGSEAWVRDQRGPENQRLPLTSGDTIDFPPNGVLFWTTAEGPSESSVDTGNSRFVDGFLAGLTTDYREVDGPGQLLEECSWKRMK